MPEVQPDPNKPLRVVGRYALYGKLATGGMATVHFGRLLGPVGFSRTVAIKRLHPQFAKDPEFAAMFLDEARLAARIQHPNVVATVDVVAMGDELFLVMDYVRGESFSRLLRTAKKKNLPLPEGLIGSVISGMLHGLHAAHEATDERGKPLLVVHRDVSPQNVLVGVDGVARVLDFGVAKAAARMQVTREGQMKGKLSYMAPEQLQGRSVDRRTDIFAAGVVLWEALTGQRLFSGDDATEVLTKILSAPVLPPSHINPAVRPELDAMVLRALEKDADARYSTAREFAVAVEESMYLLSAREVGEWVEEIAGDSLELREEALAEIESISAVGHLSAFNDSDPQLMRTLIDTIPGGPQSVKTLPEIVPPFLRNEDGATEVYTPNVEYLPIDDPTQIYRNTEELTQPGLRQVQRPAADNPFAAAAEQRKRLVYIALGTVALLLLGFLISGLFSSDDEVVPVAAEHPPDKPASEPTAVATKEAKGDEAKAAEVGGHEPVATTDAPKSESPAEVQEIDDLPPAEPPKKKLTKPANGVRAPRPSAGKKPSGGDCAQPWYIDDKGIRRIKAKCL